VGNPNFYLFRNIWSLDCPPAEAYEMLREVTEYTRWWPEVKEAHALGGGRFALRARALLPYSLSFVGERRIDDPAGLLLELAMTGDLEGFSRFRIESSGGGSRILFEEQVIANKALLRRLALVARPVFCANHWLMMRRGQAGLRTYAAGFRRGRERIPPA
jgi:hypothetical protein